MAADDTAYQDNPYGTTDPTALFQNLTDKNNQNYQTGGMQQGAAVAGLNPAMQHSQAVQARLKQILAGVGQPEPNEDPLDHQMRQAQAVSTGMTGVDPNVSMRADQQMLRLQNAKTQMAHLQAETSLEKAQATEISQKTQLAGSDPMIMVKPGKDSFGMQTFSMQGKPVSMFDENGQLRTGWSNELAQQGQGQEGLLPMRMSKYTELMEKLNTNRAMAAIYSAQQRAMQLQGGLLPPEGWATRAQQVADGLAAPMQPPINTRNPAAVQNYENYQTEMRALGYDPSTINENVYKENAKVLAGLDHGPTADLTRSFNVAVQHTQVLKSYFSAQKNHDVTAMNAIENWWADATGQPIPKTVNAMNDFVADEWVKGIVGQKPALADRIQAQAKASRNSSDAQFNSVMDGWASLGAGQLAALQREQLSGLRKGNGETWDQSKLDQIWYGDSTHMGKLAPETVAYMKGAQARAPGAAPAGGGLTTTEQEIVNTAKEKGYDLARYRKYILETKGYKLAGPPQPANSSTPNNPRSKNAPPEPPLTAEDLEPAR